MRALALAAVGFLGAAGTALAQPAAPLVEPCRAILDASERLRCYDEDANFDFSAVVRRELECDRAPKAAEIMKLLIRRSAIRSMAFFVSADVNYFALAKPEKVDGLTVVAVFGFDESGQFPFVRSRGNALGPVFGIVTRENLAEIDKWRLRHSPGLLFDETASNLKGAKDLACMRLFPPTSTVSAGPLATPPDAPKPAESAFDAGLAPKPR